MSGEGDRLQRVESSAYAIDLLRTGLRSTIVAIESGLSISAVRAFRKLLTREVASSGALPESASIIGSRQSQLEATMLMTIYVRYGGKGVFANTDMRALLDAFGMYRSLRRHLSHAPPEPRLDVNDAWVLARDLRTRELMFRRCRRCTTRYVHAQIHRQRVAPGCPACRPGFGARTARAE